MTTGQDHSCAFVDLGTVPYREAWDLQRRVVAARHAGAIPDVLLLLEHPHTFTIGRRGDDSEVLASPAHLEMLGATVIEVDRGGLATYHGPGQLVGYPILDLRPRGREVHSYLRNLEEALINALGETGIPAQRVTQKTGVWVEDRKIASIGVRFSRWISSHGFALNVTTDLSYFNHIVPCGMPAVTMTSVAQEFSALREMRSKPDETSATAIGIPDMALLRSRVAHHLAQVFALQYLDEYPPALDDILGVEREAAAEAVR
ncbi:MAG: lipoyl(octanoyl) transferase LipB [Chloroflexota bacterium]|nr:lipoyl(octanoyl) transferase LipB [Chloroflexota bacterium]MDE2840650.1 lipoyl(octanoyl) transferase LipB [Chloroflexota bacterium]MDE2931994.1 lipoyl(octanoyl) transferase LipB [Chloroflexota bacterium]